VCLLRCLEHETGGGEPADRSSDRESGRRVGGAGDDDGRDFALPTVPEPPETVQACPAGWEKIVTE
jgi:hypothetical protein